jgi:hypothetical protein
VKDYLGNILHRGPLSNGLYNFSASLAHLQPQVYRVFMCLPIFGTVT